jgi:hypothetical protein
MMVASMVVRIRAFDTLYSSSLPNGWTPETLGAALRDVVALRAVRLFQKNNCPILCCVIL